MGVLIAGDAGSAIVASGAPGVSAIALEGLASPCVTPGGIPAFPFDAISPDGIDRVEIVSGEVATRDAMRAWALARGVPVSDARAEERACGARVVSVASPTTGSGKTGLTRRLARGMQRSGVRVAVVRHPIANPETWRTRAHTTEPDDGPLELREELAPVLGAKVPVVTGSDPEAMLAEASALGDVVVWDGGGSAPPWVRPDIRVVVVDLVRTPPPWTEAMVRDADAVVLAKADAADETLAKAIEADVRAWNPDARVVLTDMAVAVPDGQALTGRHVVVVEDWPSLLLGGLGSGAGAVAARRFRCHVEDPRPHARGAVAGAMEAFAHIGSFVPSLGRTADERDDLAATIRATPAEAILWASPASPDGLLRDETRPVIRVYAEMMEVAGGSLADLVRPFLPGHA